MRLRSEVPRQTAVLNVRMYPEELDAIRRAAKRAGQSIAEWVRENLLKVTR
jgi:predicted HicB family RNase H-like nuclease